MLEEDGVWYSLLAGQLKDTLPPSQVRLELLVHGRVLVEEDGQKSAKKSEFNFVLFFFVLSLSRLLRPRFSSFW